MGIKTKNDRATEPGESRNTAIAPLDGRHSAPDLAEALMEIGRRCSALPDLDTRDADEILGNADGGEHGNQVSPRRSSAPPAPAEYAHINHDEKGVPFIQGTAMKVVELVMAQRAHGWSPEELHFQHPHLSLGQVHSALAYCWDHRDELDQDIERRTRLADEIRSEIGSSPLAEKLRALRSRP